MTMKSKVTSLWSSFWKSETLQKLEIRYENGMTGDIDQGPITALFNPAELKFNYDVSWKSTPIPGAVAGGYHRLEFQNVQPATLSLDLFFDTYEGEPKKTSLVGKYLVNPVLPTQLWASLSGIDVLRYTAELEKLARVDEDLHRPPLCELQWGNTVLLQGVLTKMGQDFIHFLPDGTPVRASVSCTFQEYIPYKDAVETHSPDVHRSRTVRRGDTLSSIAQEVYNDAGKWRVIAQANNIRDPRAIRPGQVLMIPALVR